MNFKICSIWNRSRNILATKKNNLYTFQNFFYFDKNRNLVETSKLDVKKSSLKTNPDFYAFTFLNQQLILT